jgi:hypothetical protein
MKFERINESLAINTIMLHCMIMTEGLRLMGNVTGEDDTE